MKGMLLCSLQLPQYHFVYSIPPDIPPIQLSYILLRNALHLSGIRSSKEASVIPDILVEKGAICSEA